MISEHTHSVIIRNRWPSSRRTAWSTLTCLSRLAGFAASRIFREMPDRCQGVVVQSSSDRPDVLLVEAKPQAADASLLCDVTSFAN